MTILLRLPKDTRLPVPHGQWRRVITGAIEAEYTLEELAWAVGIAQVDEPQEQMDLGQE